MQAIRDALKDFRPQARHTNVGLWLGKFLPNQPRREEKEGAQVRQRYYKQAIEIGFPDIYPHFYQRWKGALQHIGARMLEAEVQGRMIVGLGAESVLETAITLHWTYGVPYIPGSALKGLAAAVAHKYLGDDWKKGSENHRILFGTTEEAGYVVFFDALYVPNSMPDDKPLALDVVTVHHPEYYRGEDKPPADWDNPNPVPFVTAQGRYLLALYGPDDWVEVALQILTWALEHEGIGAKTAAGYGRMRIHLLE